MSDVPYGVLLVGGLDCWDLFPLSPEFAARRVEDGNALKPGGRGALLAVGCSGYHGSESSPEVANHLGTVHHEIHFTVQEGLDAIRDVIYPTSKNYDVTTIRA
ncbi:asparagine synthase-related protein [Shigella flexneri]